MTSLKSDAPILTVPSGYSLKNNPDKLVIREIVCESLTVTGDDVTKRTVSVSSPPGSAETLVNILVPDDTLIYVNLRVVGRAGARYGTFTRGYYYLSSDIPPVRGDAFIDSGNLINPVVTATYSAGSLQIMVGSDDATDWKGVVEFFTL